MHLYKRIVKDPVQVVRRQWNADGRGKLIEGLRNDDKEFSEDFGQAYVTTINSHRVKAWHMHEKQTDRMLLLRGTVRFVGVLGISNVSGVLDVRLDFVVSDLDPYLLVIPPTIYHGFQNMGDEEAYILNIPDRAYDRTNPDEYRVDPHGKVDFPWDISLDG